MQRTRILRSGSRRGPSSVRRRTTWADFTFAGAGFNTVQFQDVLATYRAITGASTAGSTIGKIIVDQNITWTGTTANGTGLREGWIVDDRAGGTVSDPLVEPHVDWMWNRLLYTGVDANAAGLDEEHHYQVRSKRKLHEVGDTLWYVVSPQLAGATSFAMHLHIRVLLLMP